MKKPIYKKWWFWVVLLLLISAFGKMVGENEPTKQATPPASTEPAQAVVAEASVEPKVTPTEKPSPVPAAKSAEKQIPGTIGLTPDEFRESFNARSDAMSSDIKISQNLKVQDGKVQNTFQHMITDHIALTGTVNKADGSIRDVMMIGQGDGTAASGADTIVVMGLMILAVNPDIQTADVGNILDKLHILDEGVDLATIDESTTINGIRYRIMGSAELGLMFSAGDANDK